MLIFLIAAVIALAAGCVIYRNYEKELIQKNISGRPLLAFLYPMGMRVYDWIASGNLPGEQERRERAEAVYVREDARLKLRLQGAKQIAVFWVCLQLAAVFGIAVLLMPDGRIPTIELERPTFGETESYVLEVEGLETETQKITVEVSGQEPDEQGMEAVFAEAFVSIQQQVLGDNPSLEEVRTDLTLPTSTIYGIRASWESLTPEYIDDYGVIQSADIPQEGVIASLRVRLNYSLYEGYYQLDVRILPPQEEGAYLLGILQETLNELEQKSRGESLLKLPAQIEGLALQYRVVKKNPLAAMPFLMLLVMAAMAGIGRQKEKEAFDRRNRQLAADYSRLVFELGTMLQCGMTVRTAWERMISEYEQSRRRGDGEKRYLYEEMIVTKNQIAAGVNEGSAYAEFGKRCREHCYLRLGSNLEQNLRQGISGLCQMMDRELTEAMEQKKNRMLQEGARLETKMLLPMFVLLGLVMAILMIPAFMSM